MIRCAEIERLMGLINVQAVTINKIAKYRNIDIEADNFLQEVLTFFDYVRLNTIVNVLNQHALCLKKLDSENVLDDEFFFVYFIFKNGLYCRVSPIIFS